MSIASELTNLEGNIEDSYDAVNDMGGIIPAQRNMDNLDQAIRTIPQSQGTTYTAGNGINIDANNEISIDDTVVAELSDLPGVMTGATSGTAGTSGLVPTPAAGDESKVLSGAGTWVAQTAAQVNSDWNSNSGVSQILNKPTIITPLDIYPVGAIYMSVNNTNPGTLFGGTWEQIKDRFVLAAGTTYAGGSTGGAATIDLAHSHTVNSHNHSLPANTGSHTLTVNEMPSHTHSIYFVDTGGGGSGYGRQNGLYYNGGWWGNTTADPNVAKTGGSQGHTHTIGGNTGNATPGTNSQLSSTQSILPPYLAVYVWKRTA